MQLMLLILSGIVSSLSPVQVPIGPPRIAMPDLVRSWSWLDRSLADEDMDLDERRQMSRRLDDMTVLFFRNDIGGVARTMDAMALKMELAAEPADQHRAAAALLISLRDVDGQPQLQARWRYRPPVLKTAVPLILEATTRNGVAARINMILKSEGDGWVLDLDESDFSSLPSEDTMTLNLVLVDGVRIPQGRWERTSVPFSESRSANFRALESIDSSAARETFRSRNARLRDRIGELDITGHVLDRNQLRDELAMELAALQRGQDPYVNRPGDTWYMIKEGSVEMPVRIYVPEEAVQSDRPLPLLIALHGAGGNEHFFLDGCGDGMIRSLADQHGMIVACPSTYMLASSHEPLHVLLDTIGSRYSIDQDRVFLLGHSLGGMTAMALVAGQGDVADGVVAIAGGAPFPTHDRIPPVLAYAAERDFIVSGDMIESSAQAARDAGAPVTPRRPDGTGHLTIVMDVLPESIDWLMSLEADSAASTP
ncbi:MAG: hypothetical protein CMJ29_03215 [Phycisphaerae bacterium]|nr:hypothetical protein [Phycisphaerae bacterium]